MQFYGLVFSRKALAGIILSAKERQKWIVGY